MYKTCPKCGYQHSAEDTSSREDCSNCGLVYSKWLKSLLADHELEEAETAAVAEQTWQKAIVTFFFHPRPDIGRGELLLYLFVFLVFTAWGIDFIMMDLRSNAIGNSWFHNVNLVFHEAGHFLFIPFGRTGEILGGSIFQVTLPLMLMLAFLISNKDCFGASICLWWSGQSMMDVAPYIADARALRLPLLGGGTGADTPGSHDWRNFLGARDWLAYDVQIATWVDTIGSGVLLIALCWSAAMLYIYYRDVID